VNDLKKSPKDDGSHKRCFGDISSEKTKAKKPAHKAKKQIVVKLSNKSYQDFVNTNRIKDSSWL
jgi:hypothetical protein